ncbi:MAG: DNA alkylation repair protein [Candidatus Geothermincolia bacterium]
MEYDEIMRELKARANPANVEGMARFGIKPDNTLGISVTELRGMAREIGKDHDLAGLLWGSGIHEGRMLATLTEDPRAVTEAQADSWVEDLDSWDICDGLCFNVLWKTPFAYDKCFEWTTRDEEFVKRAGFALMAKLALSDKKAPDDRIAAFLPVIVRESSDERNFVKKAVNWALRQVGKRNLALNGQAIATAREIAVLDTKSARWIAADALRELEGDAVQARLAKG